MGIGIFNKIKNGFRKFGSKIKDVATKIVDNIPKVVDVGKQIIDKVKPITKFIPGVGQVIDTIDTGLSMAGRVGSVGKSILDKV